MVYLHDMEKLSLADVLCFYQLCSYQGGLTVQPRELFLLFFFSCPGGKGTLRWAAMFLHLHGVDIFWLKLGECIS